MNQVKSPQNHLTRKQENRIIFLFLLILAAIVMFSFWMEKQERVILIFSISFSVYLLALILLSRMKRSSGVEKAFNRLKYPLFFLEERLLSSRTIPELLKSLLVFAIVTSAICILLVPILFYPTPSFCSTEKIRIIQLFLVFFVLLMTSVFITDSSFKKLIDRLFRGSPFAEYNLRLASHMIYAMYFIFLVFLGFASLWDIAFPDEMRMLLLSKVLLPVFTAFVAYEKAFRN